MRRAIADRPTAHWSLSGRTDFVATVAAQLVASGVPASRIHKGTFWDMHAPSTVGHPAFVPA